MKKRISMALVVMFVFAFVALPASAAVCTVIKPSGCVGKDGVYVPQATTPTETFAALTVVVKGNALATAEAVRTTVTKAKKMNKK